MTAQLPQNLDVLSRPVTYVLYECWAKDQKEHAVETYLDVGGELVVNTPDQMVVWSRESTQNLDVLKVRSKEQPVLRKAGDDLRIDWGCLYIAAQREQQPTLTQSAAMESRKGFAATGTLMQVGASTRIESPAAAGPVSAVRFQFAKVSAKPSSHWLLLAYDDLFSIQYMDTKLRAYWRHNGWEAADLLNAAANEYKPLAQRCKQFDAELMADLTRVGGENYARLAALAYRQCFAAGKFVADAKGQPLQFCKENASNGCIGTSDVFYPMAPQFLLFGPSLAKSFLVPFMNYASSKRWKFPFAPHDLGTYPHANGQVYGGKEKSEDNQMPVEESGNLLLLFAAIAEMEGNADFAGLYWPKLTQWAGYLKQKGLDPEKQLCTDDFAGHLAHNINLSAKAICALGAFGKLCALHGDRALATEYSVLARQFGQQWIRDADDGDHYRLAFDKPGTWSQKYNLIWDRILGLDIFPPDVARKEMDFYKKVQNRYGLPLDNRKDYTKLDWITWTATLTQNRTDFETLIEPIYQFLNSTPDRLPMTDWYDTRTARRVGFTGRPVVGGVFAALLYDKSVWRKWSQRDLTKASGWAPFPEGGKSPVIPAADDAPASWRYTTEKPTQNWMQPGFVDSKWPEGKSGFGKRGTPGALIGTTWDTTDIWLRKEVDIPKEKSKNLQFWVHHDEDAEIYINGTLAAEMPGWTSSYDFFPLRKQAIAALHPGKNVIAAHCHQTGGGQYFDLGIVKVVQDNGSESTHGNR